MEPWLTLPGHSELGLIQCLCLIQCHFLGFISPRPATARLLLPIATKHFEVLVVLVALTFASARGRTPIPYYLQSVFLLNRNVS